MSEESGTILCPYCGAQQARPADRCATCGGFFDSLSLLATQQSMGPWFVRDVQMPHRPGCSFDVLRREVERGKINANTVIRGPTTNQFWSLAHNVPGVAHLMGFCYACGAQGQDPNAGKCHTCGAKFIRPRGRDLLATDALKAVHRSRQVASSRPAIPPTPRPEHPLAAAAQPAAAPRRAYADAAVTAGESGPNPWVALLVVMNVVLAITVVVVVLIASGIMTPEGPAPAPNAPDSAPVSYERQTPVESPAPDASAPPADVETDEAPEAVPAWQVELGQARQQAADGDLEAALRRLQNLQNQFPPNQPPAELSQAIEQLELDIARRELRKTIEGDVSE